MQNLELALDNCVKCSDCNAACPVAKVYPDFPGPKALGPDMERFRREGVESDSEWVEYCMGCHRCDMACPHGVNVVQLIAKAKAEHHKSGRRGLRDHWLARPSLVGSLCSSTSLLTNAFMNLKPSHWVMASLVHITPHRNIPDYSAHPLRAGEGVTDGTRKTLFFLAASFGTTSPQLDAKLSNCWASMDSLWRSRLIFAAAPLPVPMATQLK